MNIKTNKLAVAARTTTSPSQTFVRRHIEYLNNGNTVVVSGFNNGNADFGKPTFLYKKSRIVRFANAIGLPNDFFALLKSESDNRKITDFFDAHDVSHAILEFAYVATEIGHHVINTGRPTFCMLRGNDASGMLRDRGYRNILKNIFPRLSGIISVSQNLLDNLAQYGISHPNSIVVPSGVNTDLFRPGNPDPGLCLCVGRMVKKKSPDVMLRAFAKVAETHNLKLEIIGGGDNLAHAQNLVRKLGISERVSFAGKTPHQEVIKNMARPMIYMQHFQTSPNGDTEGMPGVIQEAMACGLPIVTTRHAGIPDHITDGENGLLVEPGDVDSFADALTRLCESEVLRKQLGKAARQYAVEKLDYRISHQKIEAFMGLHNNEA